MTSARDLAQKRGQTINYYHPTDLVERADLNARDLSTPDNVAHIRWLADEIRERGFLQTRPLSVIMWEGQLVLTEGHCRLAAVRLLDKEGYHIDLLPALTEPQGTSMLDLWGRQASGNGSSKPLNDAEMIANLKRIMASGVIKASEAAKLIGKSAGYVSQLLALQQAPVEAQQMVKDGKATAETVVKAIKKRGPKTGLEALKNAEKAANAAGRKRVSTRDMESRTLKLTKEHIEVIITILRKAATAVLTRAEMEEARVQAVRLEELMGDA